MGSGGERERHAEDQYCPSKRTRCNHRCGYFPVIAFATSITRAPPFPDEYGGCVRPCSLAREPIHRQRAFKSGESDPPDYRAYIRDD